jgi:hypothetical protein
MKNIRLLSYLLKFKLAASRSESVGVTTPVRAAVPVREARAPGFFTPVMQRPKTLEEIMAAFGRTPKPGTPMAEKLAAARELARELEAVREPDGATLDLVGQLGMRVEYADELAGRYRGERDLDRATIVHLKKAISDLEERLATESERLSTTSEELSAVQADLVGAQGKVDAAVEERGLVATAQSEVDAFKAKYDAIVGRQTDGAVVDAEAEELVSARQDLSTMTEQAARVDEEAQPLLKDILNQHVLLMTEYIRVIDVVNTNNKAVLDAKDRASTADELAETEKRRASDAEVRATEAQGLADTSAEAKRIADALVLEKTEAVARADNARLLAEQARKELEETSGNAADEASVALSAMTDKADKASSVIMRLAVTQQRLELENKQAVVAFGRQARELERVKGELERTKAALSTQLAKKRDALVAATPMVDRRRERMAPRTPTGPSRLGQEVPVSPLRYDGGSPEHVAPPFPVTPSVQQQGLMGALDESADF